VDGGNRQNPVHEHDVSVFSRFSYSDRVRHCRLSPYAKRQSNDHQKNADGIEKRSLFVREGESISSGDDDTTGGTNRIAAFHFQMGHGSSNHQPERNDISEPIAQALTTLMNNPLIS